MTNSKDLFYCFNLDYLEASDILGRARSMDTKSILEQSLYILNEDGLIEIFENGKFKVFEKSFAMFWVTLFKSKRFFDMVNGGVSSRDFFDKQVEGFTDSSMYNYCFERVDWKYLFSGYSNLVIDRNTNFFENVAISMANKGLLDVSLLKKFNQKKVVWNYKSKQGRFILDCVCSNEDVDIKVLKKLLRYKNVKVDLQDKRGNTALMNLCSGSNLDLQVINVLISNGASLDIQNEHGWTVLMHLCSNVLITVESIDMLIGDGVGVNTQECEGWTPLMILVCTGSETIVSCVKKLLNAGADLSIKNEQGKNALDCYMHYALKKDEVVLKLLKGN